MNHLLRSLYGRISILYLLLSVGLVLLCAWVTVRHLDAFSSEVDQKMNRKVAQNIAHDLEDALRAGAYEAAVASMADHLMMLHPALELYVLDETGRILAHSPAPEEVQRHRVSVAPIEALLGGEVPLPIRGDYPCSTTERRVFSAVRRPARRPACCKRATSCVPSALPCSLCSASRASSASPSLHC